MKPIVIRIPTWARRFLGHLPRWHETLVPAGHGIRKHAHAFLAVYYTFGVSFLETATGSRRLPPAAMILVPRRHVHGWSASVNAIVGHFHRGHPAHRLEQLT